MTEQCTQKANWSKDRLFGGSSGSIRALWQKLRMRAEVKTNNTTIKIHTIN